MLCNKHQVDCMASAVVRARTSPDGDSRGIKQADEVSGMSIEDPHPPERNSVGNIQAEAALKPKPAPARDCCSVPIKTACGRLPLPRADTRRRLPCRHIPDARRRANPTASHRCRYPPRSATSAYLARQSNFQM